MQSAIKQRVARKRCLYGCFPSTVGFNTRVHDRVKTEPEAECLSEQQRSGTLNDGCLTHFSKYSLRKRMMRLQCTVNELYLIFSV